MTLSLSHTIAMEEDSWTPPLSGIMSRTASEAPSRTSWASCSSFNFEGFDDSRPVSIAGSLGSLRIKNTFLHLDPESSDSEDELDMRKSATAPPAPASDEPSTCQLPVSTSVSLPEGALKGTKSYNGNRTPKVTFDLTPTFFEGRSPEMGISSPKGDNITKSLPISHLSSSSPYAVKNTFVHLDKSLAADSDLDLPTRSVSEPAIVESCTSPVGSPLTARSKSSSFPGEFSPLTAAKASELVPRLAGPMHVPAGSISPLGLKLTSVSRVDSWPSPTSSRGSSTFMIKNAFFLADDDGEALAASESVSQPELITARSVPPRSSSTRDIVIDQIAPSSAQALPSVGAALHNTGNCKPCAWFWKPESCQWGVECGHCHLCPVGELRRRKKEKQAEAKALKAALKAGPPGILL